MPIAPNFLERLLLGRLNLLPGLLLDYGATLGFRAVLAAVRLGIFDALTSGPRATSDLAAATTVNPGALGPLLVALRSLGYVQGTDRGWSLTRQSRRWLRTGSPDSIVAGLPFLEWNAFGIWNDLEAVVRSGSHLGICTRSSRRRPISRSASKPGIESRAASLARRSPRRCP